MSVDVKSNLLDVLSRIKESEKNAGRKEGSVKLLAVSKFHSCDEIISAARAGQILFGENRVQEAAEKFNEIRKVFPETKLHIIGTLQTNKVKKACEIAECIESVDRIPLLLEIEKQCSKLEKNISVLFEIHTGEDSKSGYTDLNVLRESLSMFKEGKFPHILPCGFMTMAPFTEDENLVRKSFSRLRKISEDMKNEFPDFPLDELSMGMSGDFRIAIEEGSTLVRIGTSLFGERNYHEKKELS